MLFNCCLVIMSMITMVKRSWAFHSHHISFSRKVKNFSNKLDMMADRKIGIFGGGTVGGGIVEILNRKSDEFRKLSGKGVSISKICVRDKAKKRDFEVPQGCEIVTDYDDILNDDNIDMVVEVMGGVTDAKDVVFKAIRAGKDVVTANKALIAADLVEIETLLQEVNSQGKNVEFRYEAAVCGGIPIIRSMQGDVVGDEISMISGIINGCTNYMLTAMDQKEKSYQEALQEASELGYAEADPTLDVGGFDARSKLKILIHLAFGLDVDENEISCRGITQLSTTDFEYARTLGGTIKLMGVAKRLENNKIAAFVSPTYVNSQETLAAVSGATNAIELISNNLLSTTYIGQGAGRFPTANSCVNDIVALLRDDKSPFPFNLKNPDLVFVNDYDSLFYIRMSYRDQVGITRQLGEICENLDVSIHSLLQNPSADQKDACFAIITEKTSLSRIKRVCVEIESLDWCRGPTMYMPVLHDSWWSKDN